MFSFFSFFFYYSAAHRDLHSFPTRRSSDLAVQRQLDRVGGQWFLYELFDRQRQSTRRSHAQCPLGRSEEHTSELQSQFHLVCRLLLEKKNQRRTRRGRIR